MARNLRDIRRKIKAIKATRQVTKAMELVAASKMRRAVQNAQMLRRYALTAWNILENMAEVHPGLHPYLTERPAKKILAILFTSDRGLCGSLNTQMFRMVASYMKETKAMPSFESLSFIAIGKKGQQFLARNNQDVVAAFPALSNHPTFKDILPAVRLATEGFLAGTYDSVVVLYPDFISALVQEPVAKVLLPFTKSDLKTMLASLIQRRHTRAEDIVKREREVTEYVFEPSQNKILEVILPQLTEMQVFQAVLEATASEHSARMVAMRSATDNASDILDDLTLTYNQTRQAGITAELAELSASKAALD
ncbi:ATP synthase F1 subunit gamma [Candidatus Peribacteria bacterium RIFCSPHIGHO2_02_FULL_52_16]|nr:MAG: ATP synthase F1 subunit gamma [Candidatus Peribacteria bacterium RIFCSPHIGHO2_01_FULL_51_35]OGJ61263.1 MAG: ATP synthase F1 subunit gamma [Candidatus Peribacteria bacterium RIFCSPHIGHO2_02_FULL_52_16]